MGKVLLGKCEDRSLDSQPGVAVDACNPRAGGQGQEDPWSSLSDKSDGGGEFQVLRPCPEMIKKISDVSLPCPHMCQQR